MDGHGCVTGYEVEDHPYNHNIITCDSNTSALYWSCKNNLEVSAPMQCTFRSNGAYMLEKCFNGLGCARQVNCNKKDTETVITWQQVAFGGAGLGQKVYQDVYENKCVYTVYPQQKMQYYVCEKTDVLYGTSVIGHEYTAKPSYIYCNPSTSCSTDMSVCKPSSSTPSTYISSSPSSSSSSLSPSPSVSVGSGSSSSSSSSASSLSYTSSALCKIQNGLALDNGCIVRCQSKYGGLGSCMPSGCYCAGNNWKLEY
jgi:hypothetical protein